MINFNANSFNPLANLKPRVKGVDDTKANSQSAINSSVNSTNTINSATNSTQNSSLSTNSSLNLNSNSSSNAQISTKFLVTDKSQAVGTSLGYGIDKDGYYTSDFNEAADIPNDYKIHSSTMESFAKMKTNENNLLRIFRSVDIAKSVGNAYKILSQVVGEDILNSKSSFSKDEIAQFPQGYEYNMQSLKVSKVYNTIFELNDAAQRFDYKQGRKNREGISDLFYNPTGTKPATDIFNNAYGGKESAEIGGSQWATTASKYTNADGTISKGGLVIGILNENLHTAEGETSSNGKKQGYDKTMSYADMLNFKAEKGEWLVNVDLNKPLSLGEGEDSLLKDIENNKKNKAKLESYKDPIAQMLEEIIIRLKEQTQKALERQRENAKKSANITNIEKVDIKA